MSTLHRKGNRKASFVDWRDPDNSYVCANRGPCTGNGHRTREANLPERTSPEVFQRGVNSCLLLNQGREKRKHLAPSRQTKPREIKTAELVLLSLQYLTSDKKARGFRLINLIHSGCCAYSFLLQPQHLLAKASFSFVARKFKFAQFPFDEMKRIRYENCRLQ